LLDLAHDALDILQHVIVPEAQDSIALGLQKCRPCLIVGNRLPMLTAIKLNHQLRRTRDKVADEGLDHDLTIEPNAAKLSIAEGIPKFPFGRRRVVSQRT